MNSYFLQISSVALALTMVLAPVSSGAKTKGGADPQASINELEQACKLGNIDSCYLAANHHHQNTKDLQKAFELISDACQHGDAYACYLSGAQLFSGQGIKQDQPKALTFYKQACDGGELIGCLTAAAIYHKGAGVAQDITEAQKLYIRACEGGSAPGCFAAGGLYFPTDKAKTQEYLQKACDGKYADACKYLKEFKKS